MRLFVDIFDLFLTVITMALIAVFGFFYITYEVFYSLFLCIRKKRDH